MTLPYIKARLATKNNPINKNDLLKKTIKAIHVPTIETKKINMDLS
jgi:hypothetical protein